MTSGREFCVIWTSVGREIELESKLRGAGFAAYCPTTEKVKRSRYARGRMQKHIRPLYPSYLFVGLEHALAAEGTRFVFKIPIQLLRQREYLLVLSQRQVQKICDAEFGLYAPAVEKVITKSDIDPDVKPEANYVIKPADMVEVIAGALSGLRGSVTQVRREYAQIDLAGVGSVQVRTAVLRLC